MMLLTAPATAQDVLFEGAADPASTLALDLGDQLHGSLPTTVGSAVHDAVAHDVADAAVRLTRVDLADVLAAGWQRLPLLRAAGQRTRDQPGSRETVVLAEHRITHESHPYVDVLLGDARLTRVSMTVRLTVDVTALAASVSGGRLAGLSSGRALVTVSLEVPGAPPARRSRELDLSVSLDLGEGLRLA